RGAIVYVENEADPLRVEGERAVDVGDGQRNDLARASSRSRPPLRATSTEGNFTDRGGDLRGVGLQREVAGVEESDQCVRNVALERLRTRRQEERIVLAPHREEGRLVGAEVLLEDRVESDIALVVAEEVELQLGHPGPGQVEVVERVSV